MLSVSIVCYLGIVLLYSCSCYLGIVHLQGVNRKCHLHIWGPPLCHMLMNMVNMLVKRRLVWFEFLLYAKMHMASKGSVVPLLGAVMRLCPSSALKCVSELTTYLIHSTQIMTPILSPSEYRWSLTTRNWWLEDKSSNLCFKIYKIPHRLYRV